MPPAPIGSTMWYAPTRAPVLSRKAERISCPRMCLIAVAHRLSDDFPLVIAANRDEFYERPALAAAPWKEDARVVGGRDVRAGGSWLAVSQSARFAAVTNIRGEHRDGPSRGLLVSNFVL